ncbi:hypothetical protein [Streptomyces glaucus]|uniref:UL36 very large tegument protein n=1 Tax=Streptomyces glaucus TaxID=284029 RepID=A0ABN3JYI8_9ACTN
MAVDRLPDRVREFADYLRGLLARLDQDGGWCGVFRRRDPEGMRACLDGREVPPWDVVEALLQDLAAGYGPEAARTEAERARALHAAALAAHDARPGARDALRDRLDAMLREQRYAAERELELERLLASAATREAADVLRLDLAWARDDHARAAARCAELRARTAGLDRRAAAPAGRYDARRPTGGDLDPAPPAAPTRPAPGHPAPTDPVRADPARATPGQRKRRRGSARFAGTAEAEAAPVVVPPAAPDLPVPEDTGGRAPRGARFAGAAQAPRAPVRAEPRAEAAGAVDREEVAGAVETLARLRAEGRSGEAHALLAEIAYWPAVRFPLLAAALPAAGLGADWATLLWEAASLPAGRLVPVADALAAAGRGADGRQVLRQGVARPAGDLGRAVLGLVGEGRHREAHALLDACVRARTPEEAARGAEPDPHTLVPLLLRAARGVSAERHRDLLNALRAAGLTARDRSGAPHRSHDSPTGV